jgi:hypothetical protein
MDNSGNKEGGIFLPEHRFDRNAIKYAVYNTCRAVKTKSASSKNRFPGTFRTETMSAGSAVASEGGNPLRTSRPTAVGASEPNPISRDIAHR